MKDTELHRWAAAFAAALKERGQLTPREIKTLYPGASDTAYRQLLHRLRHSAWCDQFSFRYRHVPGPGAGHYAIVTSAAETEDAIAHRLDLVLDDLAGDYHTLVEPDPDHAGRAARARQNAIDAVKLIQNMLALRPDDS